MRKYYTKPQLICYVNLQDVDGWYYLLTEEVGRKKHLQAQPKQPVLTSQSTNIPAFNKAVEGQERIVVSLLNSSSYITS